MATFHFELVSPDKLVFSGEVDQVDIPGSEGDFGVLAGHAPMVSMLRPGIITVTTGSEKRALVVLGGFAEAGPDRLTVLADMASGIEEFDRAAFAARIAAMETRVKTLDEGSLLDREITKLDRFKELQTHMTGTAMH